MQTLNVSNLNKTVKLSKKYTWDFNCWGATQYILDKNPELEWIDKEAMEEFLDDNTVIIEKEDLKRGDILCLYDSIGLSHTAVYIRNGVYFHKKGCNNGEYATLESITDIYYNYEYIEFRRLRKE